MRAEDRVPEGLKLVAGYGWRILVLAAVGALALTIIGRLELVVIALFVALILTSLMGPIVNVAGRVLPRPLSVAIGMLVVLGTLVGVFYFIITSVVSAWPSLVSQLSDGVGSIETWLRDGPLAIQDANVSDWINQAKTWVGENRGALIQRAVGGAGAFFELFAVIALSLFSTIFFLAGGRQIWEWMLLAAPNRTRVRVDGAGMVAWQTFAGYTRGIVVVAATNAVLVCVGLLLLKVPLAIPLSLLVFFGTFIPLIGAPLAMVLAAIVALAARGPLVALAVIGLIVLIGQLEGHVLQPLVMSRAVSIHPLAVAVSVAAGTLLAGIFGAVVAVPVVSVIYAVWRFWLRTAPRPKPMPMDPTGVGSAEPGIDGASLS